MINRLVTLFLILIITLTGCSTASDNAATTVADNASETTTVSTVDSSDMTTAADPNMTTVIDGVGREVVVPKDIDSISALYTVVGHIVIMLDEGNLVTSCSKGLKRDKLILSMVPEIENIYMPKDGGNINVEELLNSEPDIIFIDMSTYWDKTQLATIEKLNIPYYVVQFNSIDEEIDLVEDVAKILDQEEEGQRYVDFYKETLAMADAVVSQIPEEDRYRVYHSVNEAVRTSPDNTLTAEWLEKAGCINVALGQDVTQDEDKYYTTLEDILLWNPEVILVNESDTYDYIKEMKAWQSIDAVKNGRLYLLPTGISRWGHATSLETPLAILWTIKTLYPEYSDAIDIQSITKTFYEDLFEYDLTDEEIAKILSGYDMRKAKNLE